MAGSVLKCVVCVPLSIDPVAVVLVGICSRVVKPTRLFRILLDERDAPCGPYHILTCKAITLQGSSSSKTGIQPCKQENKLFCCVGLGVIGSILDL